jgi:Protein of unknown function (DUF1360)
MATPATHTQVQGSIADESPEHEPPLGGYAVLMSVFVTASSAFMLWLRRSSRELPERIAPGDLALIAVATHKAARTLAKDRVTSVVRAPFTRLEADGAPGEVEERPRGRGLRRAIGELLTCPFCLGLWIATAFAAGLVVAPRPARWIASVLVAHFGSEVLQIAYKRLEDAG